MTLDPARPDRVVAEADGAVRHPSRIDLPPMTMDEMIASRDLYICLLAACEKERKELHRLYTDADWKFHETLARNATVESELSRLRATFDGVRTVAWWRRVVAWLRRRAS